MSGRRVVVTGIGIASPLGNDLPTAVAALREGRHGIVPMPEWAEVQGLSTRLAGVAKDVPFDGYPRKKTRSMGRVALLATYATERALAEAGIGPDLRSLPDIGLAYGSTHGSSSAQEEFCRALFTRNGMRGIPSTSYLKIMSNTCVVNLANFFGIQGRVISTCSACTSSSNAIGYGFEAIRAGQLDVMVCGGAEEMHFTHAVVFDILYATSRHFNDRPGEASRPFDEGRDGLVVAEGAARDPGGRCTWSTSRRGCRTPPRARSASPRRRRRSSPTDSRRGSPRSRSRWRGWRWCRPSRSRSRGRGCRRTAPGSRRRCCS